MSADRLREAARVLRERAEAATDGPWTVEKTLGWDAVDGPEAAYVCETAIKNDPNAAYIATMHPGVGLALADLLDRLAHDIAALDENQPRPEWIGFILADLILGSDQ